MFDTVIAVEYNGSLYRSKEAAKKAAASDSLYSLLSRRRISGSQYNYSVSSAMNDILDNAAEVKKILEDYI